jgi:hypothetical protein
MVLCGLFSLELFVDSSGQKALLFQEMDEMQARYLARSHLQLCTSYEGPQH